MGIRLGMGAVLVLATVPAVGHEGHAKNLEEVVVYGRAQPLIGNVLAASSGQVSNGDIELPPLLRVGELVEAVPGMVATQHSGTGKANQYFLRGFNLDHGTDFSASVDGVPINMRTHGHGQGYLDLNFLIPELVERTVYRKGPYAADAGDFSSAGSVEFSLYQTLEQPLVTLTLGEDRYRRLFAAGSTSAGSGDLTVALDAHGYDGPWELEENLEQYKGLLRYTFPIGDASGRLTFMGYDARWNATDQIPRRAVASGRIGRLGFIDPDLGGRTERYALSGALDFGAWDVSAYAVHYELALFSNFTYFLNNPVEGDEFEQRDERLLYGASATGATDRELLGRPVALEWGGEVRVDDIDTLSLYETRARRRTEAVRSDNVRERSAGIWAEAEIRATEWLRATLGVRADGYDYDVDALRASNSGSGDDAILSPKASLAWRLNEQLEAYANWGRGFHSNDVRGATIEVDPASGARADTVDVLAPSEGAELGLRFERGRRFNATMVGFWLKLDSELVFVGDAGATEAVGASRRRGIELSAFWQATPWLALNADYTRTDAEFTDAGGGGKEVPGAVASTATLGANAAWVNDVTASLRVRYLGEAPLVRDDSVRAEGSLLVNAGVAWRISSAEVRLELFNVLDSNDNDIAYFYASRLPGEPAAGVEDVHFHPLEPRTLRASLTWHW